MEDFESCSNKLSRLLDEMITLGGQSVSPAVTAEWLKRAKVLLDCSSALTAEPRFAALKSTPQVCRYRGELIRLKEAVELCQQQLLSQRKAIQSDGARLKRLKALTATLRSVQ